VPDPYTAAMLPVAALEALRARARRLLVVLPHPDDEAYGCAGLLRRYGDDPGAATALFCLTRGEASAMGRERGIGPDEVAAIRRARLDEVARLVDLDVLIPGTFPDSGLARHDVHEVIGAIRGVLDAFEPQVVVGHDPRGINAHPDHIASHWALRHALHGRPIRFAMLAYPPEVAEMAKPRLLFPTPPEDMDARITLTEREIEAKERCLRVHDALVTLVDDESDKMKLRPAVERFDFFGESFDPPLDDLFDGLA